MIVGKLYKKLIYIMRPQTRKWKDWYWCVRWG